MNARSLDKYSPEVLPVTYCTARVRHGEYVVRWTDVDVEQWRHEQEPSASKGWMLVRDVEFKDRCRGFQGLRRSGSN